MEIKLLLRKNNKGMELVILKLGGSVITKKSENKAEVNKKILKRLAKEIKDAKNQRKFKLILVHGAGPFGHILAKKYKLNEPLNNKKQIEGFALTHQSMEKLNFQVVKFLQKEGLNAIAYQPSSIGILNNGKLSYFPLKILKSFINLNLIPVLYGDVLIDKKIGLSILSGDHIVSYLAEKLNVKRVILCTDVDGIFTSDPKKYKNAKLIPILKKDNFKIEKIEGSQNTDVTGGMKRKVNELLNLANKGISSEIINGLKPNLLKKALLGEKNLGTLIEK